MKTPVKKNGERRFGRWVASVSGYMPLFLRRVGKLHIISLRKANPREVKRYDKTPKS